MACQTRPESCLCLVDSYHVACHNVAALPLFLNPSDKFVLKFLATDTVFPGCCTCSSACTLAFQLASASHEQAFHSCQTHN